MVRFSLGSVLTSSGTCSPQESIELKVRYVLDPRIEGSRPLRAPPDREILRWIGHGLLRSFLADSLTSFETGSPCHSDMRKLLYVLRSGIQGNRPLRDLSLEEGALLDQGCGLKVFIEARLDLLRR